MQWVSDKEISHLHFRFGDEIPENKKNTVVNETNINSESEITLNPKWVKNHRSNGYDIVFQDDKNVLYLYSNSGKLFWKKKLK
jgi:outer membrane protein assembly factor BamB